jgi:hypothetical protein
VRLSSKAYTGAALAVLVAACAGGAQPPIGSPVGTVPATTRVTGNGGVRSWMAPQAKTKDLLYVASGDVEVYTYPQGALVGQLTGFGQPVGTCTDKAGDVYITDREKNTVVEYAHGGSEPIETLPVPGNDPESCAVDPKSGDLAVATIGTEYGEGANVAVYHDAQGTPAAYTYAPIEGFYYCAYDGAGDLFVDGAPAKGYGYDFEMAELARGGTSLEAFSLTGGNPWAAPLQWNRDYLTVGQPVPPYISQYALEAGYGKFVAWTKLTGAYDAFQFIIAGDKAIVTNEYFIGYIYEWDVLVFDYPGGTETREILNSRDVVYSVALSRRRR